MSIVVIIACGEAKLPRPARAEDLYCGPLFRQAQKAAKRIGDRYYIVSAKHGLLHPSRIIAPYEKILPLKGDPEWGAMVHQQLLEAEPAGWTKLVVLAGRKYRVGWFEHLTDAIAPIANVKLFPCQVRALGALRRPQ